MHWRRESTHGQKPRLVEPLLRLARGERSQRHQNFGVVGGGLGNLGPGEKCRNIHDFVGVNAGVRTSHMVTGQFPVAAQSVNLCSRPVDQRPDDLDLEPIHLGTGALDGSRALRPRRRERIECGRARPVPTVRFLPNHWKTLWTPHLSRSRLADSGWSNASSSHPRPIWKRCAWAPGRTRSESSAYAASAFSVLPVAPSPRPLIASDSTAAGSEGPTNSTARSNPLDERRAIEPSQRMQDHSLGDHRSDCLAHDPRCSCPTLWSEDRRPRSVALYGWRGSRGRRRGEARAKYSRSPARRPWRGGCHPIRSARRLRGAVGPRVRFGPW